jgi:hypothetical protein
MQLVGNTSHPIDDQGAYNVQGLENDHLHTGKGEFDVTVSDGPSHESDREKQSEFVDTILESLPSLPIPPPIAQKILAMAIKMKNLGGIGDEIALLLNPPDPSNLPPEAQAAIAQIQGQLQQAQQEAAGLHMEHAGKVLEQQTKIILQQMKNDNAVALVQLQNDIKVLIAEVTAKSQDEAQRQQMFATFWKENHSAAHEVGLQAMDHQHSAEQSAQQATLAAQTADAPGPDGQPQPGPGQPQPGSSPGA